jgi:hypothetical protein
MSFEYDVNMTRLSSDQQPRNIVSVIHTSDTEQCATKYWNNEADIWY